MKYYLLIASLLVIINFGVVAMESEQQGPNRTQDSQKKILRKKKNTDLVIRLRGEERIMRGHKELGQFGEPDKLVMTIEERRQQREKLPSIAEEASQIEEERITDSDETYETWHG